ncbi:hypothetical protein BC828DRAFT_385158 [Blastocladiella britannica]|nr:hypothetical protein BC828DRAFT_385158 [Blastocladiella britannica]
MRQLDKKRSWSKYKDLAHAVLKPLKDPIRACSVLFSDYKEQSWFSRRLYGKATVDKIKDLDAGLTKAMSDATFALGATARSWLFFLIDPTKRIPSSAQVAPQRADWLAHAVLRGPRDAERIVASTLPIKVVKRILLLAPHMMTMAEAKEDRLKLMDERTVLVEEVNMPEFLGIFNMCEH